MKSTGFGAVLPSFVPVFAGAIERVQQLSISLESRAFGSSGIKTSYRQVSVRPFDWLIAAAALVFLIACIVVFLENNFLDMSRTLVIPAELSLVLVGLSALGFVAFVGSAIWLVVRA
jgi:hypothetical protein